MKDIVFLLLGFEYYGEEDPYTDVLGIYNNLENVLEDIKHYEQDKKNYWCSECDLNWDELDDLTEDEFKEKRCPDSECRGKLEYVPRTYCEFIITKHKTFSDAVYHKKDKYGIDYSDFSNTNEEIYRCKYNDKTKTIDQWYLGKEQESRSENDPININNFTRNIVSCDKNE